MFEDPGFFGSRLLVRMRRGETNRVMKSLNEREVLFLCMLNRSSPRRLPKLYLVLECRELLLKSLAGESEAFVPGAKVTERDMVMVIGRKEHTEKRVNRGQPPGPGHETC